jgi:two-component system cell cycle response regulator
MTEQKILTVDDDKVTRLIVSTALRAFACRVLEAADGVEGLALANRERPDLILLDDDMPAMDGTEMLIRLKANPQTRDIPVLMLTANSRRDSVVRLLRLGVKDYLVKPITPERILERLGRVIRLDTPRERAGGALEGARPIIQTDAPGERATRSKRSDDRLQMLVVDDKPAILELIVKGLAGTSWQVQTASVPGEAFAACNQARPDVVLISLSLAGGAGFNLFRMLRAAAETKALPILALSVRTAVEEQTEAQQLGFDGIVTKPIDLASLRQEIIRALGLDTSHRYFQERSNTLLVSLPGHFDQSVSSEVTTRLREKVCEAVDAGLNRLVIDLSQLQAMNVIVLKLGLEVTQLCSEFGLRYAFVGSEAVSGECVNYQETKDWTFARSFEEAIQGL